MQTRRLLTINLDIEHFDIGDEQHQHNKSNLSGEFFQLRYFDLLIQLKLKINVSSGTITASRILPSKIKEPLEWCGRTRRH